MRYALIEEDVVVNVIEAEPTYAETLNEYGKVIQHDTASPGWLYDLATGELSAPPAPAAPPELVLTTLASDDPNEIVDGNADVTCKMGSTITAEVKLCDEAGDLIARDATFRVPLRARDGRERIILVVMEEGVAGLTVHLSESGAWAVTEDALNADLPPDQQMRFKGLQIYTAL